MNTQRKLIQQIFCDLIMTFSMIKNDTVLFVIFIIVICFPIVILDRKPRCPSPPVILT